MCGIVSYFGGEDNNLARVLSGMSAIIYRAPDSTGVGLFGDDAEPVRTRRALGSVSNLVESLASQPAYPNTAKELMNLWSQPEKDNDLEDRQIKLLLFEGFSPETAHNAHANRDYPLFKQLTDLDQTSPVTIGPGQAGRPDQLPEYKIKNADDLRELIQTLAINFDLSPAAVKVLVRHSIHSELNSRIEHGDIESSADEILAAFDFYFEKTAWDDATNNMADMVAPLYPWNESAGSEMLDLLGETPIRIPEDYDRDGVRCIFRLLDGALLSRLPAQPALQEKIFSMMAEMWPEALNKDSTFWRYLYMAEKAVNLYGRAAAAALAWMQKNEIGIKEFKQGFTDPITLLLISQPIIGHGRWAIQSPVTLHNAHPLLDENRRRCLVLNGQFNNETESVVRNYLQNIGMGFRSENSTEYMTLLWSHYYNNMRDERDRFEVIREQTDAGLEDLYIGSQSIDFSIYNKVRGLDDALLDQSSLIAAVRQMVKEGGQAALTAISIHSPYRLYAAAHNRPVFIVRRPDSNDVIVVSDINAAMGLFPQKLILDKAGQLRALAVKRSKEFKALKEAGAAKREVKSFLDRYEQLENDIISEFMVEVYPMDGEEMFACIETRIVDGELTRLIQIMDFDCKPLADLDVFTTVLNPLQTRQDVEQTFYETHLNEIPDRLTDLLSLSLPEGEEQVVLPLREQHLRKRFGRGMAALRRILLVGMGSSHNVGLMASSLFHKLIPDLDLLVIRPVEVDHLPQNVDPEKDLVVLLSWSGASADMVQFAKELRDFKVAIICITEKPFSDLALIAAKSGGIIPIQSGEEVTYSAIKGTPSMLLGTYLLALWLASRIGDNENVGSFLYELSMLPEAVAQVIADTSLEEFSKQLSDENAKSRLALIIDAVKTTGIGNEAALKLAEASWNSLSKPVDYSNLPLSLLDDSPGPITTIISATIEKYLPEALEALKLLFLAGMPLASVSYDHDYYSQIQRYTHGLSCILPKVSDEYQPLIDLVFYTRLAFYYGIAHGRNDPGFPRNRAKSVTVTRSRPPKMYSATEEQIILQKSLPSITGKPQIKERQSLWENKARFDWERSYYREIKQLAAIIDSDNGLESLLEEYPEDFARLSITIFEEVFQEGEIVFLCLDRQAYIAGSNAASFWNRMTPGLVRATADLEAAGRFSDDVFIFVIASETHNEQELEILFTELSAPFLWLGPRLPASSISSSCDFWNCFILRPISNLTGIDHIFLALNLIMTKSWKIKSPGKAAAFENALRLAPALVQEILNDPELWAAADEAMVSNRLYCSSFFVGAPFGSGPAFVHKFDESGALAMECIVYGEEGHGPIVAVDPAPEKKFLRLLEKKEMEKQHGQKLTETWEAIFLNGIDIDDFLTNPSILGKQGPVRPFMVDGAWYLPVLRPDYDASEDSLVVIDLTNKRYWPQAFDSLATYGARYARIIVITQEALEPPLTNNMLPSRPVSHILRLPALPANDGKAPIPELLAPLAMNIVSTALAASAAETRRRPPEPLTEPVILKRAFGVLGDSLTEFGIGLKLLDDRLIEAIQAAAPMVRNIQGVSRYEVMSVNDIGQLEELIEQERLFGAEEAMENFRMQSSEDLPFYLVHPDQQCFHGKAWDAADKVFSDDYWDMWFEVYGDARPALYYGELMLREGLGGEPRIDLPAVDQVSHLGLIYQFYVEYHSWRSTAPLDEQLSVTANALGGAFSAPYYMNSKYARIVSKFNSDMVAESVLWRDCLLALAPRSYSLVKSSWEFADMITQRTIELMNMLPTDFQRTGLDFLETALNKIWQNTTIVEDEQDETRWAAISILLVDAIKRMPETRP